MKPITAEPITEAPKTKPKLSHGSGQRNLVRHIVELDAEGKPSDQCLCGHIWDRVFVPHGDDICQECVDIARKRGG